MKKTRWFPASVNPVRVGEYEVRMVGLPGIRRRYWTGKRWFLGYPRLHSVFGIREGDKWRGLAKKP